MPSKYLFLSNADQSNSGGVVTWNNLPTLSESTRECYVSISNMELEFIESLPASPDQILIKANLPYMNYFSSNNDLPVLQYLITDNFAGYKPNLQTTLELLTNDNLKRFQIQIVNGNGNLITEKAIKSINLTLKLDYIDQQAMTQQYLSQKPMTLS